MKISVLILTLNEEINISDCIEVLQWCDDIVVLDSKSCDATRRIAKEKGARVYERTFDNYASQRNYGLKEIPYKHPWVLMVDADERWPERIAVEIVRELADKPDYSLFYFLRKDMFMGRWLKRSSGYPTWFGRLVRPDQVTVMRDINEEYHTKGKSGYMKEHFIHYPFNKGIAFWFERHNRYSSMESKALVREMQEKMRWQDLYSKTPTIRRKAFKQLFYRLPCRPFVAFLYLYVIRLGFMDGIPGYTYVRMRQMFEKMVDLKVKELRRREKGLPV
jgi:glycosyltransferase involved in cell wall biosynthesis